MWSQRSYPQPYAPRRSRPRRTRPLGKRAPRSFSRCEPRGFELVEEAWAGAEPLHVAAAAFEEWVGGEAVSFDALDFNDLVDLAGEEALFAVLVGRGTCAVNDDVDLAQPIERLLGADVRASGEGEASEVAQRVVGCFAVDAGHAGVAGGERPEHGHRFGAAAFADDDPAGIEPERA